MYHLDLVLKPVRAVRLTTLIVACVFWVFAVYGLLRPGGVWPIVMFVVIGLVVWLYTESLRIVLTHKALKYKQYGITRWSIDRHDVEFVEGRAGAYGGFPALLVYSRTRKKQIGTISRIQFGQNDLAELQSRSATI
ncbi:MAG: hypothetical protein P4L57_07810 [Rhizomicrobium sp.]|nr:hypothetical protein [Rhizomicrobium sp.]